MPTEQQIRQWIQEAILQHRHDGDSAQQVHYPDVHDLPVQYSYLEVVEPGVNTVTGDGQYFLHIPIDFDGLELVEVHALVGVAGTTGTTDIQISNTTQAVDMLSTILTIDSGEVGSDTAATPAVIDEGNKRNRVDLDDILEVDVDAVSTTPATGLYITLGFK